MKKRTNRSHHSIGRSNPVDELVINCDRFKNLKHSTNPPYAYTENSALMTASVLNSQKSVLNSFLVFD